MTEKNIEAEIKKKHQEFDDEIDAFIQSLKVQATGTPQFSPAIEQLRQTALLNKPTGTVKPPAII